MMPIRNWQTSAIGKIRYTDPRGGSSQALLVPAPRLSDEESLSPDTRNVFGIGVTSGNASRHCHSSTTPTSRPQGGERCARRRLGIIEVGERDWVLMIVHATHRCCWWSSSGFRTAAMAN